MQWKWRAERSRASSHFPVSTGRRRVKRLVIQDDKMDSGLRCSCAAEILYNPIIWGEEVERPTQYFYLK